MVSYLRIVTIAFVAAMATSVAALAPAMALDDDSWIQDEHQPPPPPPPVK